MQRVKCQVNVKRSRFGWLASSNPLLVDAIATSFLSLERLFWRGRRWFPQIPGQNRVSQLGKLQTQGYASVYVCVCVTQTTKGLCILVQQIQAR